MADFFQLDSRTIETEEDLINQVYPIIKEIGFSAGLFSYTPVGWLPSRNPGVVRRAISIGLKEEIFDSWLQHHNLKPTLSPAPMSHSFDVFRKQMVNRISPKMFSLNQMLSKGYEYRSPAGDRWLRKIKQSGVEQLFSVPHFSVRSEFWSLGLFRYAQDSDDTPPTAEQSAMLVKLVTDLAEVSIERLHWREIAKDKIKKPLTKRELDCLYWASKGHTAEETADELNLQVETVRKYIKNACYKLNARNKVSAVSNAHQLGLLGYTLDVSVKSE